MGINVIYIFGASGSGTSTLGGKISKTLNYKHFDVDDYYWETTNPPFFKSREREKRIILLKNDIDKAPKCVITGSLCGWGDVFTHFFDLVILLETPVDIRITRLEQREYRRYGDRILQGGDMYENHKEFIEWAKSYDTAGIEKRSKELHEFWLKSIVCTKITIDGTSSISENLKLISSLIT